MPAFSRTCRCEASGGAALGWVGLPGDNGRQSENVPGQQREQVVEMPWFPEFASAVELARLQTRAAGQADPVGQYFTALNEGDAHAWRLCGRVRW